MRQYQPKTSHSAAPRALLALCLSCCIALAACSTAPASTPEQASPSTRPRSAVTLLPAPGPTATPRATAQPAAPPDAAVPEPATPAPPATPFIYRVKDGDTLLAIARRFSVSAAGIQAANNLADPDQLAIDQELIIPAGDAGAGDLYALAEPAAAPPVNPAPVDRPSEPFIYRVQAGDTLLSLSARYGVPAADIQAANNLASADAIVIDQELLIPVGGLSVPATGTFVHRVEPGDTLFGLAMRYGVTVADIMALNRLASADALAIGQDLRIPTTADAAAAAQPPSAATEPPRAEPPAATPATSPPTPVPTLPPQGGLEQYRAWMEEAHAQYPYAESTDTMWAVMMCESGGYANLIGSGTYYGLFQYRQGTWAGGWNPYRDNSIFDPRAQIFATAKAWLEGHQGWWRGCWPR